MTKYIGNLNEVIDTKELLDSLGEGFYEVFNVWDTIPSGTNKKDIERWKSAGYPDPICDGPCHFPHFHFNSKFLYAINSRLNIIADRCAISVTRPGQVVPPHIDQDGREKSLSSIGEIKGFHIHLGQPEQGHVFMIENQAFHMQDCGNIYEWDNWESLHSGANVGLTTRYIMAIRGVRPHKPLNYQYLWNADDPEKLQFKLDDGRVIPNHRLEKED